MSTDFAGSARIAAMQSPRTMLSSGSVAAASALPGATFVRTPIVPPLRGQGCGTAGLLVKRTLVNGFGYEMVKAAEHFAAPPRC